MTFRLELWPLYRPPGQGREMRAVYFDSEDEAVAEADRHRHCCEPVIIEEP